MLENSAFKMANIATYNSVFEMLFLIQKPVNLLSCKFWEILLIHHVNIEHQRYPTILHT